MFESQIPVLAERELPGPNTWNSVARFLRGMESRIEFLTLNSRPGGGVYFDIDLNKLRQFIEQLEGKTIVEGNTFTLPTRYVKGALSGTAQGKTITVLNETCVWIKISKRAIDTAYKTGQDFPIEELDDVNRCIYWPIYSLYPHTRADGTKYIEVVIHHHGDIFILVPPYFLAPDYQPDKELIFGKDDSTVYATFKKPNDFPFLSDLSFTLNNLDTLVNDLADTVQRLDDRVRALEDHWV